MKHAGTLSVAAVAFVAALRAQEPAKTPSPGELGALLREGNALHDRGDYEGAIAKYRQILALDPGNPQALYETAYSLYAEKKLDAALEAARQGLQRPSPIAAAIDMLIGNIEDDRHEPARAIEAYKAGIAANPTMRLLHFNLGLAYLGQSDFTKARAALEAELDLFPSHASSHYYLGRAYLRSGYRAPALLAFARFLVLEPGSARSTQALAWIDELYAAGTQNDGQGNVCITLDSTPKDEGDFSTIDLLIPMAQASGPEIARAGGREAEPREVRRLVDVLRAVGGLSPEDASAGFASRHYVPYFAGLRAQDLTEAYAYYALQASKDPAMSEWVAKNRKSVERLLTWSSAYRWAPTPDLGSCAH
jgi:tetratricopeptide (TPR) repeat protein